MGRIADEYADALLQLAVRENALEEVFSQAASYLNRHSIFGEGPLPEELAKGVLADFLAFLAHKNRHAFADEILERFLELALEHIGVMKVEVVSAVPLTDEQLARLQQKLVQRSQKKVQLSHRVDPSLIAGLRLIAGDMVMDTSVKGSLAGMKENIYRGVYSLDDFEALGNQLGHPAGD